MFNKKLLLLFIFSLIFFESSAQDCTLSIRGQVFDEVSKMPLSFVTLSVQQSTRNRMANDKGYFYLDSLCVGEYQLSCTYLGYQSKIISLDIRQDTFINIQLTPTSIALKTVVVEAKKEAFVGQSTTSIDRKNIEDNSNKNLSGLLENETGVYSIKNGSGISKPIVHGLYGNRLTILNNGIAQSGQQWGNDHSPEIDPFAADKIILLKGASTVEYDGGNLGSVILVEPSRIQRYVGLRGQVNYLLETNGLGHNLNARLQQYSPFIAWRISGTLKKYGDKNTPDYFLNNTGLEQASLAVQLEKSWKNKLFIDFYASTFNTRLGVLRGSHIGNLTDLKQALTNQVPFFTEPNFSYQIEAPKQHVSHHLVKIKTKYFLKKNQLLELVVAGQLNDRKEFDVRRSGRIDIPALSLLQYTFNSELKYTNRWGQNWKIKLGMQNAITDNTNDAETGLLPLIPDYIQWKNGLFGTLSKTVKKIHFNLGVRYDYTYQKVVAISTTLPREIVRYNNPFHTFSSMAAIEIALAKTQAISFNTGYATRNPAINELYSSGLHQGVSGIEEGNIHLKIEKAFKNTLEYKWFPTANFSVSALAYHQYFEDYIYLNPQPELRLTIRGAFPVFEYQQTDAHIYGLDLSTQFAIGKSISGVLKYSYLRGHDIANKQPLIFMPPNRLFGSLKYAHQKNIKIAKATYLQQIEFELTNRFIFEQKNLLPEQDFAAAPPAYTLFGLKASAAIHIKKYKISCFVKIDNLFNVRYRDYLNRQRYFSDEMGRNITLGLIFKL